MESRPLLKISQLNVRSIIGKFHDIEQMILGNRSNTIFCFSETWLQDNLTVDSFLSIPNFAYFRRDRAGRTGGGLLVYIPGDLCTSTRRRPDLETNAIECLAFELLHDPRHILLFAYRPPDQSPTHFFESLHTLLATASSESTTLSVFGDLNAKHSSWQSDGSCNTAGNKFFELLLDFGLTQCVHSPTRFSSDGHSCSVIDIYATNRPELITDIEISDPVSDHCMVTASIKMHRAPPKSTKINQSYS